ncbi:hypothetical protein FQB35_13815 [Crassaminicella thermophila]|uniref:IPT/TIG domain-containing protein n=1 Tax=Crassaminicella thermophila TaxID=2599308 RepID=A0A5C0SFX7_CRATE|nr:IPT/TIG domain-containing protein [Crassaminicella thermophila]QEK13261.1 hypothetical protein FQB35_13815 [Crassaminicella thermophila]
MKIYKTFYLLMAILIFMGMKSFYSIAEEPDAIEENELTVTDYVYDMYPVSIDKTPWYDEKSLKHDIDDTVTKDKYFIKVRFYDVDGKLALNDLDALKNCIIRPISGLGNLVDTEFINELLNMPDKEEKVNKYIFVKKDSKAILYIPVKQLSSQTTYQVIIQPDVVSLDTEKGNELIEWTFVTSSMPFIKKISVRSIPQDYDEDEPIYIQGDFFRNDINKVKVYFNDIKARDLKFVNEHELEVYLPDGRDRLKPGIYNIILENDANHKRITYEALGVVSSGEYIPNEEYRIKEEGSFGEVHRNLKVSEDTLLISPSDINEKELEFDLDELMGKDVYLRKIQYEGDKRYKIGMLKTKSKWADITLYGLTLSPDAEDDKIEISLGRTEPSITKELKRKLRGEALKSDFIQVSGENFKMNNVRLSIPLKYSNGKNIKVLRYDEDTRNFYETNFTVNLIDRRIEMLSPCKGIFVVVQD